MGFWDVLLFNIVTVLGPRWIAAAAHNGSSSISLWILAPLLILTALAGVTCLRFGSVTHLTWSNMLPTWNWDTVNFWSQIAFAFTGLELVSAMSAEIRDPRRTLPRAALTAGALIAFMYMIGTASLLAVVPATDVDPKSGVFHAITVASVALKIGFVGVLAAVLVTVGNAGGVGSTVAGIARVPFVVGIDRYLPKAFGKIHPRWRTPYVAILVQAVVSALVLRASQINETTRGAYQVLIDAAIILYFIPFLYMFAAAIKLAGRKDRRENPHAVLVPGGKAGVYVASGLGFVVTLLSIGVSLYPPGDSANRRAFLVKVVGWTAGALALGLVLYYRGRVAKKKELGAI